MQAHLVNIFEEDRISVKEATGDLELEAMTSSYKDYNTCMFIYIYDNGRYRSINTTLDNEHLLKKDAYTKTF